MNQFRETATASPVVLPKNMAYSRVVSKMNTQQCFDGFLAVVVLEKFTERKPRTA
jgi:hypothetical protein